MAWLSVGTTNDDLCDKMIMNGVLEEGEILNAFRSVDRGDFVPEEDRIQAYHDRPFKKGSIHISAPHMYVTVLEALDLKPGNAFLNVGSGSGYLCCLAWCMLGEHGLSHGIEISARAVEFSRTSIEKFSLKRRHVLGKSDAEPVTIVHGNCFHIDVANSAVQCKYDRIYVGAGCPERRKQFFYDLLADGGVLVLPINETNQMVKVTKITGNIFSASHVSNVHFAPLIETEDDDDSLVGQNNPLPLSPVENQLLHANIESLFIHQRSASISSVMSVSSQPSRVQLPTLTWAPVKTRHRQFPFEFREIVKLIILASNQVDYSRPMRSAPKCLCSVLPTPIWYLILSYASRDWFVPQKSEVDALRWELMTERRLRRQAEERLALAEQARRVAERERDLFRSVMMRVDPSAKLHSFSSGSYHLDLDDEEDDDEENEEEEDNDEDDDEDIEEDNNFEEENDFMMDQDAGDSDDEDYEVEDEEEGEDEEDQDFQDAVDLPPLVELPTLHVAETESNASQIYLISEDSNNFSSVSTSFGSNTTRESVMTEAEEMEVGEHDRSSFLSTSSSSRENSISESEVNLSFDESSIAADAEEHFASD